MGLFTFRSKGITRKLVDLVYPVGSLYMSTNSTNPSTLFGGAWQPYAQGRCLIGAGEGDDGTTSMSFTAGSEHGKYNLQGVPKHKHQQDWPNFIAAYPGSGSPSGFVYSGSYSKSDTTETGEDEVSIIQPSIVTYIWRRVS